MKVRRNTRAGTKITAKRSNNRVIHNAESREETVTFACIDYIRKRRDTVVFQIANCERQSRVELPKDGRCASQE